MLELLDRVEGRYAELERLMGTTEIASQPRKLKDLAREHKSLGPTVAAARRYRSVLARLSEAKSVLSDTDDPELRELALDVGAAGFISRPLPPDLGAKLFALMQGS